MPLALHPLEQIVNVHWSPPEDFLVMVLTENGALKFLGSSDGRTWRDIPHVDPLGASSSFGITYLRGFWYIVGVGIQRTENFLSWISTGFHGPGFPVPRWLAAGRGLVVNSALTGVSHETGTSFWYDPEDEVWNVGTFATTNLTFDKIRFLKGAFYIGGSTTDEDANSQLVPPFGGTVWRSTDGKTFTNVGTPFTRQAQATFFPGEVPAGSSCFDFAYESRSKNFVAIGNFPYTVPVPGFPANQEVIFAICTSTSETGESWGGANYMDNYYSGSGFAPQIAAGNGTVIIPAFSGQFLDDHVYGVPGVLVSDSGGASWDFVSLSGFISVPANTTSAAWGVVNFSRSAGVFVAAGCGATSTDTFKILTSKNGRSWEQTYNLGKGICTGIALGKLPPPPEQ
jgi:hypothetical protein